MLQDVVLKQNLSYFGHMIRSKDSDGTYSYLMHGRTEVTKRSSRIVIIFTSVHSIRWEGGGQGTPYVFQKCCLWCIAILRTGFKINIFKVIFWKEGVGHKKSNL